MSIDTDHIVNNPFVVGAMGAAVTALHFLPGASWWQRATNVFAGAVVAGFLTPALVQWLHLDHPSYASAMAFILGLLGMSLSAAALEYVRSGSLREALGLWLSRRS